MLGACDFADRRSGEAGQGVKADAEPGQQCVFHHFHLNLLAQFDLAVDDIVPP
jgi:hypothetical protein